MTRTEHLLTIATEECSEVAQRISKALRFGLQEIQLGERATNAERIVLEFNDLMAVLEMLCSEGDLPILRRELFIVSKKDKVDLWLKYSEKQGTLDKPSSRRRRSPAEPPEEEAPFVPPPFPPPD